MDPLGFVAEAFSGLRTKESLDTLDLDAFCSAWTLQVGLKLVQNIYSLGPQVDK